MVRLPTNVESLVGSGESSAEQYELLRWARCLSAQGLSDAAGVVALLQQVEREHEEASRQRGYPIAGGPTVSMAQCGALASAGYLDEPACVAVDQPPGDWSMVERVVAEARAARSARPPQPRAYPEPRAYLEPRASAAADTIVCRTCGRQLPANARYCGYCGIRVS
ncbi:MAG: zinc ribbon domain-containing protein [Chloroflexi bacterium]|nr:zinc ribbon domain-containing protein [Chloroflexota bacterium]